MRCVFLSLCTLKEDTVKKARRYYDYFALVTNKFMDSVAALKFYHAKDDVKNIRQYQGTPQYVPDADVLGVKHGRKAFSGINHSYLYDIH